MVADGTEETVITEETEGTEETGKTDGQDLMTNYTNELFNVLAAGKKIRR